MPSYKGCLCWVLLLVLPSCASRLEAHKMKHEIEKLKSVRVQIEGDDGFSVKKSRTQMSPIGPMFGLIGAGIEAAARASTDSGLADTYADHLKNFHAKEVLKKHLQYQLTQVNRAAEGVSAPSDNADGVLIVDLDEWGLRPCQSGKNDDSMRVFVKAEGKLDTLPGESTLWSKQVTHTEHECHLLEKYHDESGLLTDSLSRSMEALADKIVNQVLYP
jgi:hypothetical protein